MEQNLKKKNIFMEITNYRKYQKTVIFRIYYYQIGTIDYYNRKMTF